jgi:hypothetical protein
MTSFRDLAPGTVVVNASLREYRSETTQITLVPGAQHVELDISALPTAIITVTFSAPPGAVPIRGALVRISTVGRSWDSSSTGTVLTGPLPAGGATLSASADGFLSANVAVVIPVTGTLVEPVRLTPVAGILVVNVSSNLTHTGIPGAPIEISDAGQNSSGLTNRSGDAWFALGSFGTVLLTASDPGYHSNSSDYLTVAATTNRSITVLLTPLPSVRVHVIGGTESSNTALAKAKVTISGVLLEGITDVAGSTVIGPVASGVETVTASAQGWGTNSTTALIAYTGTTNVTLLIYLSIGNLSVLVVFYANDLPVAGAIVTPTLEGSAPRAGVASDVNGWSNFTGIEYGPYLLNVSLSGYFSSTPGVRVIPGLTSIVLIPLYLRVMVNITVRGPPAPGEPEGPIAGAQVSWSAAEHGTTVLGTTDANGRWSGFGPFPGVDEFSVGAFGYTPVTANLTVVPSSPNDFTLHLFLTERTGLTVRVFDASSHAPLSGALVTAVAEPYEHIAQLTTSSDGSVSFDSLPDGTYLVGAGALNYISNQTNVELFGTTPGSATLNLTPATSCTSTSGCNAAAPHPTFLFWSGGPLTPTLIVVFALVAVIPLVGGIVYIYAGRRRPRAPPPGSR